MTEVTRTADADADILDIIRYLQRRSSEAASEIAEAIETAAARLARQPLLGRPRPELAPGLRSQIVWRGYLIFYVVTEDGIEIQRVLHGSRNITPSMFNL